MRRGIESFSPTTTTSQTRSCPSSCHLWNDQSRELVSDEGGAGPRWEEEEAEEVEEEEEEAEEEEEEEEEEDGWKVEVGNEEE